MMLVRILPSERHHIENLHESDIITIPNLVHYSSDSEELCESFIYATMSLQKRSVYLEFDLPFKCSTEFWKSLKSVTKNLKQRFPHMLGYIVNIHHMQYSVKIVRVIKDIGLKVILRFPGSFQSQTQNLPIDLKILRSCSRLITGVCIKGNVPYNMLESNAHYVNKSLKLPFEKIIIDFEGYGLCSRSGLLTPIPRSQCISKVFSTTKYDHDIQKDTLREQGFYWENITRGLRFYFDDYQGLKYKMTLMKSLNVKHTMITGIEEDCPMYHPSSIYSILTDNLPFNEHPTMVNSVPSQMQIHVLEARKKCDHANVQEEIPNMYTL